MRILVVSPIPTHPATEGNRVCIHAYCEALQAEGHDVEFLYAYRPWAGDAAAIAPMRAAWPLTLHLHACSTADRIWQAIEHRRVARTRGAYQWNSLCPRGLAARIAMLVQSAAFDAVIVNYWSLVPAVERLRGVRRILYAHDLFADRFTRTGSPWLSTDTPTEKRALNAVDAVLAIQDEEAALFRDRTATPVFACYTYSPIREVPSGPAENLLFLAGPNPANVAGIRGFMAAVMPGIRARFPEVRLLVGGGVCRELSAAAGQGLELLGQVADVASFYARGSMCVNPVSLGSGLKIKMCEALAHGRPVLTDPHCLAGLPRLAEAPIIPCRMPSDYVSAVAFRLASPTVLSEERRGALTYADRLNDECVHAFVRALGAGLPATCAPSPTRDA